MHATVDAGAILITPIDYLYNGKTRPSVNLDGVPIYKDYLHLRPAFVRDKDILMDQTILVKRLYLFCYRYK